MSDPTVPGEGTPDSIPTEALELADQQPVAPEPVAAAIPGAAPAAAAAPSTNHTRTILEVAGAVVAAGLVVLAGIVGFVVGHATGSDGHDRFDMANSGRPWQDGPDAGGPMGQDRGRGQGEGYGQGREDQRLPGQRSPGEQRFYGPGDGAGDGMPFMPGMPGMDPRGIDPDGDDWMGGPGLGDDQGRDDQATPDQALPSPGQSS
jgi:hypothetical protein